MRNANGFGSISKLSGNRRNPFMVRKTVGYKLNGQPISKIIGYFKTRKEATIALVDYNKDPKAFELSQLTFKDVWKMYTKQTYIDIGKVTPRSYSAAFNWCTDLHDMKMSTIKLMHLQETVNACTASVSTKKNIKIVMNQIFKYSIGNDIVSTNYAELVKLPTELKSDLHKEFTTDEIKLLWQNKSELSAKICLILIYTGMRPGSIISMETKNIHIDEQYMIGGVKTAGGKNRVIPIADCILPFIKELYNPSNEFLLGSRMSYDTFTKNYFYPVLNELNITHLPHDGRGSCESILDRLHVQRSVIDAILGHVQKSVGEKYYRNVTVADRLEAVNKMPHWNT